MKINSSLFLSVILIFLYNVADAQLSPGISSSNWGGVSNVTWNPAIADPKYKVDISLGTGSSGMTSNYNKLTFIAPFINTNFSGLDYNILQNDLWQNQSKPATINGSVKNIAQFIQIEGPGSFLFPFGNNKNALAISYHFNAAHVIHGLDESMANYSNNIASIPGSVSAPSFTITNAAWIDYDITYSRVVLDKGKHFLKIGVTGKLLHTLKTATVQGNNTSYNNSGSDLQLTNMEITWSQHTDPSFSCGGDIGLVYEFRPKKDKLRFQMDSLNDILPRFKDLYLISFGFSVIDIGVLPGGSNNTAHLSSGAVSTDNFNFFNTDWLISKLTSQSNTIGGNSKIILPTRFNIFLDYNIGKGFGLNLSSSISQFFVQSANQVTYGSYVALTPRFDMPMFGAYLPINMNFNGKVGLGTTLRLGPVWVGVSDLIGLGTGIGNCVVYAGAKIPIYYHKPRDRDGDMVSDRYDLCPNEKGSWQTQGCSDKDGDGIRDAIDECPTEKGPAYLHGCPDSDGDSIADKYDSCKLEAGPRKYNGCPDRDGDGIIDKYDQCPDIPGLAIFDGCPDTDGDGVPDREDKCPLKPGPKEHHGCPDSDGDGVYDDEDDSPYEPGPKENHGAPWGDADGDGIPDNEDKCKLVWGVKEYQGCPTPPKPNLIAEFSSPYDTLSFEGGKADLSFYSIQKLKIYAKKLLEDGNKMSSVVLYGRTDNMENDSISREDLSIRRAKAVRSVLISEGIDSTRVEIFGYGDTEPLADNANPKTRGRNRSVVIITKIVTD